MKAETGSAQPSSWTDNSQQLQCCLPQCCLQTRVTITLMLIHGTLEVSAQPPAGFPLAAFVPRGCAVAICLALFLSLPADRHLALLSILSFGVFQNGLTGLDGLPEGKP